MPVLGLLLLFTCSSERNGPESEGATYYLRVPACDSDRDCDYTKKLQSTCGY